MLPTREGSTTLRLLLSIAIAGLLAAGPAVGARKPAAAKGKAKVSAQKAQEDAAWSAPARTAKKPAAKAKQPAPRKNASPDRQKATVASQPAHTPLPGPAAATNGRQPPAAPDTLSDADERQTTGELDDLMLKITARLEKAHGEKPDPSKPRPKGLAAVKETQEKLEKALSDPKLSQEDRDALKQLKQQRDSALYFLACIYISNDKQKDAEEALRLVAASQGKGTPMYDAAVTQLAQMGKTP
jgi:hypothetical protein